MSNDYAKGMDDLRPIASIFWPHQFYEEAVSYSFLPILLETQDDFISILKIPVDNVEAMFDVLDTSSFSANLFLMHLIVLTDFGKEMLQRINSFFDILFPQGHLSYLSRGRTYTHNFQRLPIKGILDFKMLQLSTSGISKKSPISSLARDVCTILIFGNASTSKKTSEVLHKCDVHKYLGSGQTLDRYIKQKYLWVSRITSGAVTNKLGHIVENNVKEYIETNLGLEGVNITSNGTLPGVTHRSERSKSKKGTTFDIVISRGTKFVAIEVSFQVTTNSVIERKGREAAAVYQQIEQAGHKIAYVVDGAGNFQRRTALSNITDSSHCTVAYADSEFDRLIRFIREHLMSEEKYGNVATY